MKVNGETHYLWRVVNHEGDILESYVTKKRDKKAALQFMTTALKNQGRVETITSIPIVTSLTDRLTSPTASRSRPSGRPLWPQKRGG
ncbi:MAG: DDE-type integrase/transposase/recombinase [Cyanobacteria bacterium P01_H01_bin.153]